MKVLLDMNLSPAWATFVSAAGIFVTHWSAVGEPGASDQEVMAYAASHGFVVITHDLDFGAILAASRDANPSVVQIRSDDLRPNAIGRTVVTALQAFEAELATGALITVEPGRTRVRILPFKRDGE